MSRSRRVPWHVPVLLVAVACVGALSAHAPAAPVRQPFTEVYDAPAEAAAALSEKSLSHKARWVRLRENDTTHRFNGCTVFLNDKIVGVLHPGAPDVDLYSRQTPGLKLCARLCPVGADGVELKPTSLAVKENTTSSVSLEVALRSPDDGPCRITYILSAGQPFVKTTAAGVAKLRVRAPCRFAVLPDFFGDDIVVDAAAISVGRAELPSENFLLHMMHGGEAIVMTVSQSRDNDIGISLSKPAPRRIESSDISYGKTPHVWVAVLAHKGVWHERTVGPADAGKVLDLDWTMPFPALWRVDWSTVDKLTDSWEMLLQHPEGKYVMQEWFGEDPAEGQSFGPEFGARDWNKPGRKRWNPVLGSYPYPCWVDKDSRGYLQPLTQRRYVERGEVYNFDGPAIVYPFDRARAAPFRTPIEKLTVVDLVRMTLGVGPCQYILDLEGQKRNSAGVATCYARDVINALFKEGTQLQNGPVIEKRLAEAVAFIRNVRERIDNYVEFGHSMRAYLQKEKRLHPKYAPFLDELVSITERLDQFYESRKDRIYTPQYAEEVAAGFRRDLLRYTGQDAYAKCGERMKVFTGIGGAQDGLVASCRMIVKVLRQRAGIAMAVNLELKDIATEVRARTQQVLRSPTAYEAPQH
ncbi:MAG TPA: hypothetical protein VM695_15695 [Phycisphaerae bacterium]|nr:hypothetical protein [Phycisphaerae bacterium]